MKRTLTVLGGMLLASCAAPQGPAPTAISASPVAVPARGSNGPAGAGDGVLALMDGRPVRWSELRPAMVEAAGAEVLSEWVLDRRIEAELERRGMAVEAKDIEAERQTMLRQLSEKPDEAVRLLQTLRENRGLGEVRFAGTLRRNAALRKLIADQTQVNDAMVRQAWREQYGEKTQVRLIMVPTLTEASTVVRRAAAGESFIDLAIALSKDVSRNQGGLLPPISADDPTYPQALRQTAVRLVPGQVSDPVTLENGFAILKCERKIAAEPVPFEKVAATLREQVRLRVQRMLMERQARALLEKADVTVLDAQLNQDWKHRRAQMLGGQ